jgi:hypothetical protein
MIHLGIVRKIHIDRIRNICLGLAGLGTNSFSSVKDAEDFRTSLVTGFQKVIRKSVEANMSEINAIEIDYKNKPIEKNISDWMRYQESKGKINDVNLINLLKKIETEYSPETNKMKDRLTKNEPNKILADLQKIETLTNFLKTSQVTEIVPIIKKLEIIVNTYEAYKTAILASLVA